MKDKKNNIQRVWGIALVLMGVALVFRVPEILDKVKDHPTLVSGKVFISFCFYFVSLVLVVGGIKKMIPPKNGDAQKGND